MMKPVIDSIVSLFWMLGPAILVLGFLIFIHELGHFLAARLVGIRVEVFSIGFGKRLIGFRKGPTDYRISAIPFGGYVRMAGEDLPIQGQNEEAVVISDESTDRTVPDSTAGDPFAQPGDRLNDKPVPHRLLVAVAGAAMNAIVAVLLTIGLAYFGINVDPYLVQPPVIAHVQADSPADAAGLTAGDRILTINTTRVNTWEDAQTQIAMGISEPMILTVQRNEQTVSVEMSAPPEQLIELGGISPPSRVFVGKVTADSPAENAGLEHGDQIVSIDGNIIGSTLELMDRISGSEGKPIQIELLRDGQTLKRTLSPKYNDDEKRYLIGIQFGSDPDQVLRRYPLNEAISKGIDINIQMGRLMFTIFKRLLTGQESVRNMGGPVMIVDMAGKAAKSGVRDLIWLTALISLNLAILNLLPIPILDGGMVIFLLIEWLIRRPVSEKIQIALQNLFFFLLISFALYITYIDVLRIDWLSWFK